MVKKRLFFANFYTKFSYFVYAPFILIFIIAFLVVIICDLINLGNIYLSIFYLMADIMLLCLQIPIIGINPEYYVFDFDKNLIRVKSLLTTKKVVSISAIKGIYWQEMSHCTLITKKYFYIVDDGSSTSIKIPLSTSQDLMRIPVDKKSKAIIKTIWPHEIQESHFPERK